MPADRKTCINNLNARRWTPEEDDLVARNIQHTAGHIGRLLRAAGFERTENGVALRIHKLRARLDRTSYTARGFALLMGVDWHTALRWIRQGWLRAERRPDERTPEQGGHTFIITPASARRFVREHPGAFDLAKVDQLWFLDLVFEGKIGEARFRRASKSPPVSRAPDAATRKGRLAA